MDIAILGLGTIGSGVYELLKTNKDINVKRILDIRCWMENMTTDIEDIISDDSISIVVETMGGLHPAREYSLKCLKAGKSYISANKLLISECAFELQAAANESGASLLFSASCGGGIPFLYNLCKTKLTDRMIEIGGILNGTSNYILDRMFSEGDTYTTALKQAQALGYAERDPASDVEGYDTLRKLLLSCAVAYAALPEQSSVPCHGISHLNEIDVAFAKERDSVIKLIAQGRRNEDGSLCAYVMPKLVRKQSILGSIDLNTNYAYYKGERIGEFGFTGQGAGKFPTANNILRDIYAVMDGEKRMLPKDLRPVQADGSAQKNFYLRAAQAPEKLSGKYKTVADTGEWKTLITEKVSFDFMENAVKDLSEYFLMILED